MDLITVGIIGYVIVATIVFIITLRNEGSNMGDPCLEVLGCMVALFAGILWPAWILVGFLWCLNKIVTMDIK